MLEELVPSGLLLYPELPTSISFPLSPSVRHAPTVGFFAPTRYSLADEANTSTHSPEGTENPSPPNGIKIFF